jgi:RNA polymerase sigma factor (sigma-70 family)
MKDNHSGGDKFLQEFNLFRQRLFRYLFYEYYSPLTLFAYKIIQNQEDAEDIVNHVFIKLYDKNLTSFKSEPDIYEYLNSATRNACLHYLKSKKDQNAEDIELEYFSQSIDNASTETDLIQTIWEAIDKLPAQRKKILQQLYWENLSSAEVASRMNLARQTVINQKTRAFAALRKALLGIF